MSLISFNIEMCTICGICYMICPILLSGQTKRASPSSPPIMRPLEPIVDIVKLFVRVMRLPHTSRSPPEDDTVDKGQINTDVFTKIFFLPGTVFSTLAGFISQ